MTRRDFENLVAAEFNAFRGEEPNASGNMKDSTTLTYDGNTAAITIPVEKVPYSVYTVVNWGETSPIIVNAPKRPSLLGKSSFLWNDGDKPYGTPKKNPNEGWIGRSVEAMVKRIAAKLRGRIE